MQHERSVSTAAFSPDGARVVTASDDKTARVWDATTGAPIGEPLQHDDYRPKRDVQPRRRAGGDRVLGQDRAGVGCGTGTPIGNPLQHEGLVNSATFSPDGALVVTASGDKTARVWDAATERRSVSRCSMTIRSSARRSAPTASAW